MRARKLKNDLFIILITSFIVIVCWIGFNIYNHAVSSTIDETLKEQITPITGSFDTATVERLNQRTKVSPLYQLEVVTPTPTPSEFDSFLSEDEEISITPTQSSTGSALLETRSTIQTTTTPTPNAEADEEINGEEFVGEVLLDE